MLKYAFKQFQDGIKLHKDGFLEEAAYRYSSLLNSAENLYTDLSGSNNAMYQSLQHMSPHSNYPNEVECRQSKENTTHWEQCKVYANFNLASIRFKQYRYDEAIHHYVEGLKLAPINFGAHVDLAKVYEMTGQWDDAIFHIDESLKISPNHTTARRRKARILEERQFYESLRRKLKSRINNYVVNSRHIAMQSDYEIDESVCLSVESLMERVYSELNKEFEFKPKERVKIILFYEKTFCADRSGPRTSFMSFPRWAVGMYDGSINVLLRATDQIHLGMMYVLLRHEYMHKIVDELSNGRCPRWFSEGLSEYKSRGLFCFEDSILRKAVKKNQIFSLDELENIFLTPKNKMRLAYIQACSLVEFIIKELGMRRVRKLLHRIGLIENNSAKVIYKLLGTTPDELQNLWLNEQEGKWGKGHSIDN